MRFYKQKTNTNYCGFIFKNKLNAIYQGFAIIFFENGLEHNSKNAAYIGCFLKAFYLNGKYYGNENSFTKELWRRFVKMQAFL